MAGGPGDEGDWRARWEHEAEEDRRALDARTVDSLLRDAATGRHGQYYNLWYSIAERAVPGEALPVLLAVLERLHDPLQQFHCAVAILHLLGEEVLVDGVYPAGSTARHYLSTSPGHRQARQGLARRIARRHPTRR